MAILSRKRFWLPVSVSGLISGVVILLVLGLRAAGAFQFFELKVYDIWLQKQPRDARWASPILIVGVTEDDIQALGHYPISDADLANALENLLAHSPRAIGIDIFRDLEAPPGIEKLNAVLTQNKNIVAVFSPRKNDDESENTVPPPPVLVGTPQIGFSHQIDDAGVDGMIRRGLLYRNHEGNVEQSLGLRLALLYLEHENIWPQADESDPTQVRLGKGVLTRFKADDGAYVGADDAGYQILLDYQFPHKFKMCSLMDILEGRVKAKDIQGKIVLVGIVAKSKKDFVYTPIDQYLHGVKIHGYVADQLLRIALNGQQPIAVWSPWQECLWIAFWGVLGGVLGFVVASPSAFCLALVIGLGLMGVADYWALCKGLWVPSVSPAVVWAVTVCVVGFYRRGGVKYIIDPRRRKLVDEGESSQRKIRVFISSKSTDYPHARQVYEYLTKNGIPAFFSEVTLRESGKATFAVGIFEALEQTKHLVLVTSDSDLANTPWVQAEWMTFINEINAGRKPDGNVVTVTIGDVRVENLPLPLRKFEAVPLNLEGLEKLLHYVE